MPTRSLTRPAGRSCHGRNRSPTSVTRPAHGRPLWSAGSRVAKGMRSLTVAAGVVRFKTRQMPTSIFLDPAIIEKLRSKAEERGIACQSMLHVIVHEHVDEC